MNTSLEARISQVIKQRQAIAHRVQPVQQYLNELRERIIQLNQQKSNLLEEASQVTVQEKLSRLDLDDITVQITTQTNQLQTLIERFARPTLNIGVVGRMGQGKSTFLKSLSGLSDDEIPARKGVACTAARSKIRHHDGETEPVVIFHSEQSFLSEVLEPYYQKLNLGPCPTSLEEFGERPLPESPHGVALKAMYKHLQQDYHAGFHHYRALLKPGNPRKEKIDKADISNYVSQNRDERGQLTNFRHLAVREVEIFCQFKRQGIGQLGLVDVPGLGDTRLGDEALLLKTLGREIDVVLFLRRPDALRFQWDTEDAELYDVAAEALPDLARRAFILINHQQAKHSSEQSSIGDNLEACEFLEKSIGELKSAGREIVNCQDEDAANGVLDRILSYLEKNIVQIEENYARTCQQTIIHLHKNIASVLKQASIDERVDGLELQEFLPASKVLIKNISNALGNMAQTLSSQMEQEDSDFQAAVQTALQSCQSIQIPSEQAIEERSLTPEGKSSYYNTFLDYIAELRVELSKSFLELDKGLQQGADKLKFQTTQVLIDQGQLGAIVSASDEMQFLEEMTNLLEQQDNGLALGFRTLSNFRISYGALIHRLIRQELMKLLDPDTIVRHIELVGAGAQATSALGEAGEIAIGITSANEVVGKAADAIGSVGSFIATASTELNGAAIHQKLKTHHQTAVSACRTVLERWMTAPNQIRYYMAKEFVDLVVNDYDIETEWEKFLWRYRDKIWPEFGRFQQLQDAVATWDREAKQVQYLNQRHRFEFID